MTGTLLLMSGTLTSFLKDIAETLEITPWRQIWQMKYPYIIVFSFFLLLLMILMIFKNKLARNRSGMKAVTYVILSVSFIYVGLIIKAQPTTTNIVILVNGLIGGGFPLGLYILEPYIFLSFLFIFITIIFWGRGVFCGWLCPYGAMTELLNRLCRKTVPKLRLSVPERIHWKLVYLKYAIFAIILGVSFYSFILSEYLSEVEPFKTFVLKLVRPWYFVLYFLIVTAASVVFYRAYCRYLCPLGAALAIPSFLKLIPLVKLKRHDLCGKCKICGRECNYQAVKPDGSIYEPECMECLDCQVNFWDEDKCPELIKRRKEENKWTGGSGQGSVVWGDKIQNSKFKIQNFMLVVLFALLFLPSIIHAKTLKVGTEYLSIGDALKKVRDGDVIEVRGGEYREMLKIEKAVHLRGINGPVIIGEKGFMVEIASRDVTVEGFTFMDNSTTSDLNSAGIYISKGADRAIIKNNRFYNMMHGIWSVSAKGVVIEGNSVEGKEKLDRNYRGNGIYLTDSQEATVIRNRIKSCRDGLYLEVSHDGKVMENDIRDSRYAIHTMWVDRYVFSGNTAVNNMVGFAIMYSKGSTINDNISAGNQTYGLLIIQNVRSLIFGNAVIGNTKGIFLYNSILNRIASNVILNNSLGVHNWGGSEENILTGNSFINNEYQVKFIAGRNQEWDGNYWSDYLGWDTTGDGIGDLPYESNTVVDHILWRYPSTKLLFASASFQLLWMLEKQFPLLKVPRVTDSKPSMLPLHDNWKELMGKYPYKPVKYYGEMEKFQISH